MAGQLKWKAGRDPLYYLKQIERAQAGMQRPAEPAMRGADYYLSAVEKSGEPEGTWVGSGLADLGISDGDTIDHDDFLALYGSFVNPRTGETLGRPPRIDKKLRAVFKEKMAAEAGSSPNRTRQVQLWAEARADPRVAGPPSTTSRGRSSGSGVMYWDGTFSVDKSTSLAHATALAEAAEADLCGDRERAREWQGRAASIWEEIEKGARAYVEFIQQECGYVRTGHHGKRLDGKDVGKHERAHDIPVAMFPQHTNRNGDVSLHIHCLWLNKVKTVSDNEWRAIDSRALHKWRGAASAIAALTMETGLTRRHGFRWVKRPKSHGRVIAGVSDKAIEAFSSRRTAIDKLTLELCAQYEADHGHAPNQRVRYSLSQHAARETRKGKPEGALDFGSLLRDWEETSRHAELGSLRDIGQSIWRGAAGTGRTMARLNTQGQMTLTQERAVMMAGLAQAQEGQAAWSRAELLHCLAQNLPDGFIAGGRAREVLDELADRVLAGEGGDQVHCLTAGEYPRVPCYLRREDGESVYRPHGSEVYATATQLGLERGIIDRAMAQAAPVLAPELAAELLGADVTQLQDRLREIAAGADSGVTGLRLDQKAVAFHALTSRQRAEVIIACAGAGKTTLAGVLADVWQRAGMGPVYGLATSSAARNELAAASPAIIGRNLAQFLGHLPGMREARGADDIGDRALILLDEASMASLPDIGAVMRLADEHNAMFRVFGDHRQLSAPESGGGLAMLARALGYLALTDALRFAPGWERYASVALRAGDVTALTAYDEHGRLHGGTYEQMAEEACRSYLADYLAGKDALLTARTNEVCRDVSRRVQGYLADWGKLDTRCPALLREDAKAYAGDLIIARKNDGDLLNTDMLRVESVDGGGLAVRKASRDDAGQRGWSAPFRVSAAYVRQNCDLGYCLTWAVTQGATVDVGNTLVSAADGRNGFYESMTRGRNGNSAFAYEPEPGCEGGTADPEIDRQRRLDAERAGEPPEADDELHDPLAILAPVVRREDRELSATETRERSMSDADHLGVLWAIWDDERRAASAGRFARAVREELPGNEAREVLRDTDDLWRALRHAELAGQDGPAVLRDAIGSRSLIGAQSVAAVLADRVRKATEAKPARLRGSWAEQVTETGDAERDEFLPLLAAAMDARERRIGAYVADTTPLWATQALGPVPEDEAERDGWQRRAARLGAYREIFGYDHEGQAIGPQPGTTSPEARAEWQNASSVMARVDGIDLRHLPPGLLMARRAAAEREMSWAPVHAGAELRVARLDQEAARVAAARHDEEAKSARRAGREARAAMHEARAAQRRAEQVRCSEVIALLEPMQETRCEWEAVTEDTRRMGLASDAELKRQGLLSPHDHCRMEEPEGLVPVSLDDPEADDRIRAGLGISSPLGSIPARVRELAEQSRMKQAGIDVIRSTPEPGHQEDDPAVGAGWAGLLERQREAILQPPAPVIPAAPEVEKSAEPGPEAGN